GAETRSRNERRRRRVGSPLPASPIIDGGGEASEPRSEERGAETRSRNERRRRRGSSPLPTSPIIDGGGEYQIRVRNNAARGRVGTMSTPGAERKAQKQQAASCSLAAGQTDP